MADSTTSHRQLLVLALVALGIVAVFAAFVLIGVLKGDNTADIHQPTVESTQVLTR